jgi:hypothetical protein
MAMIEWKEDADIEGWSGGVGSAWALDIWPHAKGGWSWCVITDDAEQNVPEGWDPTLEDAMVHSESAYLDWRDVIEGRKAVPDEHDETAEIVADAVAEERAAVVAFLREQAGQWDRDAAGWAALNHASVMVERGLHRPVRA